MARSLPNSDKATLGAAWAEIDERPNETAANRTKRRSHIMINQSLCLG